MKKNLKIIRNYIGRYLFIYLIKLKKFDLFPPFVIVFPKSTYKAVSELMKRGYLDIAEQIIETHPFNIHEEHLVKRIQFMKQVRNDHLEITRSEKEKVEKINVLFAVHNSLPYDQAGYAIRTHTLAKEIRKSGLKIIVCTRPGYPWDLQKHRDKKEKLLSNKIDDITYIRLKDNEKTFKKGADSRYIEVYARALEKEAKIHGMTLIHAHSNYLNAHAAIAAANTLKIPSVYEVRGFWHKTRLTLDTAYKEGGMFEYESLMEKAAIEAADAVVTISTAMKELMIGWGIEEKKIHLIPNTVDTVQFVPKNPSQRIIDKYGLKGKTVVGFAGSLTGYEGLRELVQAVDALINDGKAIALLIVGDGRERMALQSLAHSKHIVFTGRVPHDEVREYYSVFDICPFPRNNVEVCRYVPPLKILEAMAMEKAVIVSDVAPLVEIVGKEENGLVCKADNMESLKQAIQIFYADKNLRRKHGIKAKKWVNQYRSINKIMQKYKKLYQIFTVEI